MGGDGEILDFDDEVAKNMDLELMWMRQRRNVTAQRDD
jgi:hypothetical protein